MIDVVFDDSHKGCLEEVALLCDDIKREHIVEIGFQLDIGDISDSMDGVREKVLQRLWGRFSFEEQEWKEFQKSLQNDLETLLTHADQQEEIRIWTSTAPYEVCGLYYTCYLLVDRRCPIYVIELPTCIEVSTQEMVSYEIWNIVPIKVHSDLVYTAKSLSTEEVYRYANLWSVLTQENAPLRTNLNGKLISVAEDFYDGIILHRIPDEEVSMAYVIGTVLVNDLPTISYSFLALRIEAMAQKGRLELVSSKKSEPYSCYLRRL